tara:strand:+ start:2742 stop:3437 length:696 start_codon:yes stop_codon:yes gene_type:complete
MSIVKRNKKLNLKQMAAVEMLAQDPGIKNKILSESLKVGLSVVREWKRDPIFIDAFYNRFMDVAGRYLPSVLMAQIREAQEGNTQAATLVLKHWGKFEDVVVHKIEAPFMQFQKMRGVEDAELVEDDAIDIGQSFEIPEDTLPKRNPDNNNPIAVKRKQTARLKGSYKVDKVNKQQMERHYWRKRAKAVGIDPLPPGRPSLDKLNKWKKSIEDAEKTFANGILSNKQKSPK